MGACRYAIILACFCLVYKTDGYKRYHDIFPHKHPLSGKLPFPIPPIPGWDPDTNPWDDYLYPPPKPASNDLMHHRGKPKVHLTSDSPALNGSSISFTAKLEYPPCQKEDANGDLVWDEHCEDANGQVRSGYVYNWTSWIDDYGFGKCTDKTKCNVFPDRKPFPLSNNWRRKSYVYVWHTMGQYFETCDGSSSSVTINTTNIPLGAEVMEVMVYRKRERRKYSPLTTDSTVFYVTDKIPLAVDISQKAAINQSQNVFFRGEDLVFKVQLHDPSGFLKSSAGIDYIWDFGDGTHLESLQDTNTHTYNTVGTMSVKLFVKAAFPLVYFPECPPDAATTSPGPSIPLHTESPSSPPVTHAWTPKIETTEAHLRTTWPLPSSYPTFTTTWRPPTEPFPSTFASMTPGLSGITPGPTDDRDRCFYHSFGTFSDNITIIERTHPMHTQTHNHILDVSTAVVTKTDISFLVKCLGSMPTSACTIVSDSTCTRVSSVMCDDLLPSSKCEVHLRRRFPLPGTYCVNITLEDPRGMTFTSTIVTINQSQNAPASMSSSTTGVMVAASIVLVAFFAFVAYVVYKRIGAYRPISRSPTEDSEAGVGGHMVRLRKTFFPSGEESRHLLTK